MRDDAELKIALQKAVQNGKVIERLMENKDFTALISLLSDEMNKKHEVFLTSFHNEDKKNAAGIDMYAIDFFFKFIEGLRASGERSGGTLSAFERE